MKFMFNSLRAGKYQLRVIQQSKKSEDFVKTDYVSVQLKASASVDQQLKNAKLSIHETKKYQS